MRILLVNPWITDFAAYDLWAKPLGLLYAGAFLTAGQPVMRIARLEEKEIEINVSEQNVEQLRSAGPLLVRAWALPQKVYKGRVREIAPAADPATREIARRERATLGVVHEQRVLKARHDDCRQEHQRLAVSLGHEESHDRQFGDIELELSNHTLEPGAGRIHIRKLQADEFRADFPLFQCCRDGVVAEQRAEFGHGGIAHIRSVKYHVAG